MDRVKKIPVVKVLTVVLIITLGSYLVWSLVTFRITGTTPKTNNVSFLTPYIDIAFSKELKDSKQTTVFNEDNIVTSFDITGSKIRVFFDENAMYPNTEYILRLSMVTAVNESVIENATVAFTTNDKPFSSLSEEQQKYSLEQQDKKPENITDPILAYLPHETLSFELVPFTTTGEDGEPELVLDATLLLSDSDIRIDREGAIAQYTQEVLDYISSLGLDPNAYIIQYTVRE